MLQERAAAEALAVAQDAEVSARAQAAELTTQQGALQTELAAVQQETAAAGRCAGPPAAADRAPRRLLRPAGEGRPAAGRETRPRPAPGSASAAQIAIDAAMGYLGLPYAWGGGGTHGPGPGLDPDAGVIGFDCSGLTQYAYAQAGISIPRNSRAQYAALPKVASDDLQAG